MSRCKCRICGKQLSTTTAFYQQNGNRKVYYCSEDEFIKFQNEQKEMAQLNTKIYSLVCDITGFDSLRDPVLYSEWDEWKKIGDNNKIKHYLEENKMRLINSMAKIIKKEYNRIRYLSAIVKKDLETYSYVEVPAIIDEPNTYSFKRKQNQRISFAQLEDDA